MHQKGNSIKLLTGKFSISSHRSVATTTVSLGLSAHTTLRQQSSQASGSGSSPVSSLFLSSSPKFITILYITHVVVSARKLITDRTFPINPLCSIRNDRLYTFTRCFHSRDRLIRQQTRNRSYPLSCFQIPLARDISPDSLICPRRGCLHSPIAQSSVHQRSPDGAFDYDIRSVQLAFEIL